MSVINNLVGLPCDARAMPIGPTNSPVHLTAEIRIDHSERASEVVGVTCEWPPSNPKWLAHSLPQFALDPLPTQDHRQRPEHGYDAGNNRDVAPSGNLLGSHNVRSGTNAKVSDGSQPPMTFDLSLSESAGSRSLNRLGRSILSIWPPFGRTRITSEAAHDEADCLDSTF